MASLSGQASPASLSKEMIRDISRKYLSAHGEVPVTVEDLAQIQEAIDVRRPVNVYQLVSLG